MNTTEKATLLFLLRHGVMAFMLIAAALLGVNMLMHVTLPWPRVLVIAGLIAPLWSVVALVVRDGRSEPSESL